MIQNRTHTIEIGDDVTVYFQDGRSSIFGTVKYTPGQPGDIWIIETVSISDYNPKKQFRRTFYIQDCAYVMKSTMEIIP
jgi:hypothetical protein